MMPELYRAGWPSRLYPPPRVGRWWVWIGPYQIGWCIP